MRSLAKLTAALAVAFLGFAGAASADPWKDESGHGKWRGGGDERGWDGDRGRHGGWDRGVATAGMVATPMTWTATAGSTAAPLSCGARIVGGRW